MTVCLSHARTAAAPTARRPFAGSAVVALALVSAVLAGTCSWSAAAEATPVTPAPAAPAEKPAATAAGDAESSATPCSCPAGAEPTAGPRDLLLTNARLVDGTGAAPRDRISILIRDGKIAGIAQGMGIHAPAGTRTLDASGMTVLPLGEFSTVEVGKRGDLMVVRGAPDGDQARLQDVQWTIRGGVAHTPAQ